VLDPSGEDRVTGYIYDTDGFLTGQTAGSPATGSTPTLSCAGPETVQATPPVTIPTGCSVTGAYATLAAQTQNTYDTLGDLASQSVVDGGFTRTTTYGLDDRGLAQWVKDPAGDVTYLTYDAVGHLVEQQSPTVESVQSDGTTGTVTASEAYAISTTGYDAFGEQVETESPNSADAGTPSAGAAPDSTVYAYDADGNQVSQTLPGYTAPSTGQSVLSTTESVYGPDDQVLTQYDPVAVASMLSTGSAPTQGAYVQNTYTEPGNSAAERCP
jgi:YD repeat-containing protein